MAPTPSAIAAALDTNTKAIYATSITLPNLAVTDISALAAIAHSHGVPLVIDNSLCAAGYFLRPIAHGADIVLHDKTWLSGSSTTDAGVIIDAGTFDWSAHGARFPEMVLPSPGYHGLVFWDKFGKGAFGALARAVVMREFGGALSPFAAQHVLVGMETLALRAERRAWNAGVLSAWLQGLEGVGWVAYPGLEGREGFELAGRYLKRGFGAVLTFGVVGGAEMAEKVVRGFELIGESADLDGSKTLAFHPWSSTHRGFGEEERAASGLSEDMIRLSVGTEHIDDLKHDITQSIEKARKAVTA